MGRDQATRDGRQGIERQESVVGPSGFFRAGGQQDCVQSIAYIMRYNSEPHNQPQLQSAVLNGIGNPYSYFPQRRTVLC